MWSETGDYRPKQNYQKGHSATITDGEGFRQFVEANPGLTQKEMGVILGVQSFQRFWGMGELSIHRWKGFELYPVINKKTVSHTTVGQALKKINFTRKHTLMKNETRKSDNNLQSFPLLWGTVATFGKPICKRRRINQ